MWDRILTWMTPESAPAKKIDVALGYQAGRIRVKLTDYSATSPAFGSHLVTATVTRPDGTRAQTALGEEAPGELAGAIDAPEPGTYYIEVKSADSKAPPLPPLAYTVSPSVGAEVPRPEPNYGLLEQLASATGGRLNPSTLRRRLTRPTSRDANRSMRVLVVAAMILPDWRGAGAPADRVITDGPR